MNKMYTIIFQNIPGLSTVTQCVGLHVSALEASSNILFKKYPKCQPDRNSRADEFHILCSIYVEHVRPCTKFKQ